MGSRVGEGQDQDVVPDEVEENPVVLDVAVAEPGQTARQRVVPAGGRQGSARGEQAHDGDEFVPVLPRLSMVLRLLRKR